MNFENIPKLVTKEDPYHIHKTLGILSLGHFGYRFFYLYNGTMGFANTGDIFCLWCHILLTVTSFQFKIPNSRNQAGPMIYPEFRVHNALFSYRSILCAVLFYYNCPIFYNIVVCYLTMIGADIATYYYKEGTTMRDMRIDETIDEYKKKAIQLFHSKMQICATLYMIGNVDSAFSPLFAIQFSSFLMTLVRKNIIKTNSWHFLYALSLMLNVFVYQTMRMDYIVFQQIAFKVFAYLRFTKVYNKYMCWSIIYSFFYLYRQYPYELPYEIQLKQGMIVYLFVNYLPMFVFSSCRRPVFETLSSTVTNMIIKNVYKIE